MDNPVGKEAAIEGSTNPNEENTAMDLWAAWQWVEHIRNLSVRARARAGYGLEEAEWMLVLAMLWTLPHSTVEELIELGYLGKSKIEGVLSAVDKHGWAGSKEMGHALGIRQRYFLLPNGKNEVMRYWGVPEEWQTGDDTLKLLHDSLPMVEVANDLLPRLWRTQAVRTPTVVVVGPKDEPHFATIDENTQLCRLIWVRAYRRSVHALAQYRNADGFRFWIAIVWQGYVCSADDKVAGLADFYNGFRTEPSGWYSEPATPAGVVYLVPDRLSGFHVTMTVAKGIPKAVVTAQGEVVEQLTPVSSPVGYLHPPLEQPNTRTVGTPFADWVREPERGAAYGEKPYMELREIGVNPGTSPTRSSEVIGLPRSDTREIIDSLKVDRPNTPGLVRETKVEKVEVETPALSKRSWKAELDIDTKKLLLPLRLPIELGSTERIEYEVELDADRDKVVNDGHVDVVVRTQGEAIAELKVPARSTRSHVSMDVDVGGWPTTITLPFAREGKNRDTNLYLTPAGEVVFSDMDRDNVERVRQRFGEYSTARGRIRKASHDKNAHRLQGKFLKRGGNRRRTAPDQRWFATSGLRMVINFPDETQLAPDLWLIIPIGDGTGLLVPVEYEQTAKNSKRVEVKLHPHFVARDLNAPFPMLMACTETALQTFQAQGVGLFMLVASFQDALEDHWAVPSEMPETAARRVGAQYLTRREWRGELVQCLDQQLKPNHRPLVLVPSA